MPFWRGDFGLTDAGDVIFFCCGMKRHRLVVFGSNGGQFEILGSPWGRFLVVSLMVSYSSPFCEIRRSSLTLVMFLDCYCCVLGVEQSSDMF